MAKKKRLTESYDHPKRQLKIELFVCITIKNNQEEKQNRLFETQRDRDRDREREKQSKPETKRVVPKQS